jgi:hypothetical protein
MPVYNRTDLLRQAVQSALAQRYRPIGVPLCQASYRLHLVGL